MDLFRCWNKCQQSYARFIVVMCNTTYLLSDQILSKTWASIAKTDTLYRNNKGQAMGPDNRLMEKRRYSLSHTYSIMACCFPAHTQENSKAAALIFIKLFIVAYIYFIRPTYFILFWIKRQSIDLRMQRTPIVWTWTSTQTWITFLSSVIKIPIVTHSLCIWVNACHWWKSVSSYHHPSSP